MTAPVIQGWCPGALRPMMSGDGLVVRVRPRGGRLTAEQAKGIAALAAAHGNGLLDLSNRANLQIRGVTEASHAALIDGLRALGCLDDSAEGEARRNIITSPFWDEGDASDDEPSQAFNKVVNSLSDKSRHSPTERPLSATFIIRTRSSLVTS